MAVLVQVPERSMTVDVSECRTYINKPPFSLTAHLESSKRIELDCKRSSSAGALVSSMRLLSMRHEDSLSRSNNQFPDSDSDVRQWEPSDSVQIRTARIL